LERTAFEIRKIEFRNLKKTRDEVGVSKTSKLNLKDYLSRI